MARHKIGQLGHPPGIVLAGWNYLPDVVVKQCKTVERSTFRFRRLSALPIQTSEDCAQCGGASLYLDCLIYG